jgi:hypothetical protein
MGSPFLANAIVIEDVPYYWKKRRIDEVNLKINNDYFLFR